MLLMAAPDSDRARPRQSPLLRVRIAKRGEGAGRAGESSPVRLRGFARALCRGLARAAAGRDRFAGPAARLRVVARPLFAAAFARAFEAPRLSRSRSIRSITSA